MSGSGVQREISRTRMAEAGYQNAHAALTNEQLTRQRVKELEDGLSLAIFAQQDFVRRGFFGRMRWLFLGR